MPQERKIPGEGSLTEILATLLSGVIPPKDKLNVLENDFQISVTETLESEVSEM